VAKSHTGNKPTTKKFLTFELKGQQIIPKFGYRDRDRDVNDTYSEGFNFTAFSEFGIAVSFSELELLRQDVRRIVLSYSDCRLGTASTSIVNVDIPRDLQQPYFRIT
jgi:hypothetical protein